MSVGSTILSKLKSRYVRLRTVEVALFGIFIALISFAGLFALNTNLIAQVIGSVLFGVIAFVGRFYQLGLHKISEESIATFLNIQYAELNSSADLVLAPAHNLPPLVKLQQLITYKNLESLSARIKFPNRIKIFSILAVVGLAACVFIQLRGFTIASFHTVQATNDRVPQENEMVKKLPSEIAETKILVAPPAYTGIQQYPAVDLNLKIQENSKVAWSLKFSSTVKKVALLTSSQDTLRFSSVDNSWKLTSTFDRNGFYQIVWKDETTHASDYYKIEIVKDQPPTIKLNNLNQFTQVAFDSKQSVEANPTITDDYGLTDAFIIATVSKGSGESVKFREEKIRFSAPTQISSKQVNAKQLLDLKKLGLEPGDELYFYVEAFDNKTPVTNRSRTETYFISIPDTTQDVMVSDGGLGVDLMPEYFRSQRQIIIDSEKLIREKKIITKKEFDSRSNELGYDQKVLRLRYGQFLGEEAESGIGLAETHAEEEHDQNEKPEDMIKEFGHQHDTENEHNLVEEKDPTKRDVDGGKKEDLLAGFVHEHDNEESATFFYQSLKMKLKAALAQMWDAELYLRLNEPAKSLPYQYTALKLLKEISNDSRIYVHRTGFEPPPIKEEKRLSADLTEIFNATQNYEAIIKEYFPKISLALNVTESLLAQKSSTLSQKEKSLLVQSGSELAKAALENPSLLPGLSALQEVTTHEGALNIETLKTLRKSYWLALPKQPAQAGKRNSTVHDLDTKLIQQLELLER
jgi:hypothetical protein